MRLRSIFAAVWSAAAVGVTLVAASLWAQPAPPACAELPAIVARLDEDARILDDWAHLGAHREANATLGPPAVGERRVVFFGDSITNRWKRPEAGGFFPGKPYVNRGLDGQLTGQMLLRFHQDVIALRPSAVVILGGTNDVAGMTAQRADGYPLGRTGFVEANLASMSELARAHGIRVVLATLTPVSDRPAGRRGRIASQRVPPERIAAINAWIRDYADKNGHALLDYHPAMADARGILVDGLSEDGVHPSAKGYALMAPLAERAIADALSRSAAKGTLAVRDLPDEGADAITFPGASSSTPRTCEEIGRLKGEVTWHDRYRSDWAELTHYADANATVASPPAVVFVGDSITDLWDEPKNGAFFPGRPYLNRGIGAQSSQQMLVRFRQDVVDLRPKAVVILAGANDMGGNTGPTSLRALEDNVAAMTELARIHGIRVILASNTPVSDYDRIRQGNPRLRTTRHPPEKILRFNRWLEAFAGATDAIYLDYHSAMIDARGLLADEYTDDGIHPSAEGYKVMAPLAERAIAQALGRR